jgi:hypothetical protein
MALEEFGDRIQVVFPFHEETEGTRSSWRHLSDLHLVPHGKRKLVGSITRGRFLVLLKAMNRDLSCEIWPPFAHAGECLETVQAVCRRKNLHIKAPRGFDQELRGIPILPNPHEAVESAA